MTLSNQEVQVWCDLTGEVDRIPDRLVQVLQTSVSGVLLRPEHIPETQLPDRVQLCVLIQSVVELEELSHAGEAIVIATNPEVLAAIPEGWGTGIWIDVDDSRSMNAAAKVLGRVDIVILSFSDETNIPLELIIAEAQAQDTKIVKKVRSVDDGIVTSGVLQHGPDVLLLQANSPTEIARLASALEARNTETVDLVDAEVISVRSIGMGVRGCVDTAAMFDPDEGILVGSTSAGGLLVCAEVHYLPYMNLRPFRVNAGAVHSYVWTPQNRTAYITDLSAGEKVLAVKTSGLARSLLVGRVKSEVRPLRIIECRVGESLINTIVQDDWHVRLFDADGKVRNCTDIAPGDRMMAVSAKMGRHVGISVSETILEV